MDSCNAATNDPLENFETPEVYGVESSELSKDDENHLHAPTKTNAIETLDKWLNLLEKAIQAALFLKIDDRLDNLICQPQSTTLGFRKTISLVDYSPTRTLAMSEPAKTGSKVGSNVSKMGERRHWIYKLNWWIKNYKRK